MQHSTELTPLVRSATVGALVVLAVSALLLVAGAAIVTGLSSVVLTPSSPSPGTMFMYVAVVGSIPVFVGLAIGIRAGVRLWDLRRLRLRPDLVEATELAMRFGKPALRFCFPAGRSIVLTTGDVDRSALAAAVRTRAPS